VRLFTSALPYFPVWFFLVLTGPPSFCWSRAYHVHPFHSCAPRYVSPPPPRSFPFFPICHGFSPPSPPVYVPLLVCRDNRLFSLGVAPVDFVLLSIPSCPPLFFCVFVVCYGCRVPRFMPLPLFGVISGPLYPPRPQSCLLLRLIVVS